MSGKTTMNDDHAYNDENCNALTTITRCGKDPRLQKEGCKFVCTTCGGLWGEVTLITLFEHRCFFTLQHFTFSLNFIRSQHSIIMKLVPYLGAHPTLVRLPPNSCVASHLPPTQVEGCTNLPELKTHDVEDLD